jgi:hypothetical protein
MLVSRSTPSIFQQIILPYLSATQASPGTTATRGNRNRDYSTPILPPVQQRSFSSTTVRSRPPAGSVEATRQPSETSQWQPFSGPGPNLGGPSTRRRTREYLGLEEDDRPARVGYGITERNIDDGNGGEEAYRRTAALALERIIKSHLPLEPAGTSGVVATGSRKGKAKEQAVKPLELSIVEAIREGYDTTTNRPRIKDKSSPGKTDLAIESMSASTKPAPSPMPSSSTTTTGTDHPFPPLIHQLLQGRQFRLATLHILNLPLYALDPSLVHRVGDYMDRHGAGKAAKRLRRGQIPSPIEKSLMSNDNQDRLPDDYWTILRSSKGVRTLDDVEQYMPGIGLDRQARFTAFCNIQLANFLSTANGTGSRGSIPPKSFPRPNSSLRQLRALLARVQKLEQHRGFIPDRVTANIILSSWVRCSLSPRPEGVRIIKTKSHSQSTDEQSTGGGGWKISPRHISPAQGQFGHSELRSVFDTISRLIDRQALELGGGGISYSRHVKPFVRIFERGFTELGDGEGRRMLGKWDKQVGEVLREAKERGQSISHEVSSESDVEGKKVE